MTTGDVYYDDFVLSDTMEEALAIIAVEPAGKLTTTWGSIRVH